MTTRERVRKTLFKYFDKNKTVEEAQVIFQAEEAILHAIAEDVEGRKDKVVEGEQYWMWQSVHNVFDYGKMVGKNEALTDIVKMLRSE
jgi:hypothetical protein